MQTILGRERQIDLERIALRVLQSTTMQEQIRRTEQFYREQVLAQTASGKETLRNAARGIAFNSVQYALAEDSARPFAMWVNNGAHRWSGLSLPSADCCEIYNPDNIYRFVGIDGRSRYEIRGQIVSPGPAQQSFVLYESLIGMGQMTMEAAGVVSALRSDQMAISGDGSFILTIDPEPANGRANHLQSGPAAKLLVIRDTLSDWFLQNPIVLDSHRLDGPPLGPPISQEGLEKRAAEILAGSSAYFVEYFDRYFNSFPANQVKAPNARTGSWGFVSIGNYFLGDDEALVMTLERLDAGYFNIQVSDPWGGLPEYVTRSSSLNHTQSMPNPDGTYTYVISPGNPGVYNWLDTSGLTSGMFAIRWQAVPPTDRIDEAVRDARVVKLDVLAEVLPRGAPTLSDSERRAVLANRAESYARRLAS